MTDSCCDLPDCRPLGECGHLACVTLRVYGYQCALCVECDDYVAYEGPLPLSPRAYGPTPEQDGPDLRATANPN